MVMFRGLLAYRGPSSGVAAFIGFAAQGKPVRFESAEGCALHTPSLLVLIQVARRGRKGYEFDRQRCADYTAICLTILEVSRCSTYYPALWRAEPLTPNRSYQLVTLNKTDLDSPDRFSLP